MVKESWQSGDGIQRQPYPLYQAREDDRTASIKWISTDYERPGPELRLTSLNCGEDHQMSEPFPRIIATHRL